MPTAIPPLPKYVFMTWCLFKYRDNFTFTSWLCNLLVLVWGVSSHAPNHEIICSLRLNCMRQLFQHIRTHPPYLEVISFTPNLRTRPGRPGSTHGRGIIFLFATTYTILFPEDKAAGTSSWQPTFIWDRICLFIVRGITTALLNTPS